MGNNREVIMDSNLQDIEQLVAAIDIGSNKISLSVGSVASGQFVSLSGLIHYNTSGVNAGRIVNVEEVSRIMRDLISDARSILGFEVEEVFVGLKDRDFQIHSNNAMVAVDEPGNIITQRTLERLSCAARALPLNPNESIVHVIPGRFLVDGTPVAKPVGMKGVRMDIEARILTVPTSIIDDIQRACNLAGVSISGIIFSPYATHLSVALQRHLILGCAIIDIGAGSTDITVYRNGMLEYCDVIPIGGNYITNHIASQLRCIQSEAEMIKQHFGYAAPFLLENGHETIEQLSGLGMGNISWYDVSGIIETAVRDILVRLLEPLHEAGCELDHPMTVFLTGGTSNLRGLKEYLENILEMKVEAGIPTIPQGMFDMARAPQFASSVGTLMHCAQGSDFQARTIIDSENKVKEKANVFNKVASWFESFFD